MGKQYDVVPEPLQAFLTAQKVFLSEWKALFVRFGYLSGAGQIFDLTIDLVQTWCGVGVPYFTAGKTRAQLADWATKKGEAGMRQSWGDKSQLSSDRIPTHLIEKTHDPQRTL